MERFATIPRSTLIRGIQWTGDRIPYPQPDVMGDSFPMTWADDGEIYTSAGDPLWGDTPNGLDVEKLSGEPTSYTITKVNPMNDYLGWGGDGPKPSGMLCVDGVLYLAFQNLLRARKAPFSLRSQHGSDAHIIYSTSRGAIWVPAFGNIKTPMFPGHRFGGPAFINYGQNNANARDGFAYAVSSDQWDNGSNLRLGRVPLDSIVRREAWEWVCSFMPVGDPAWSPDLEEAVPVLSLHRWISIPEMVYLAGIRRYLLLLWRLHQDFSPDDGTDLMILDAPEPWGPFSLVHFEEYWEGKEYNPYCPRIPLKWLQSDGVSGWLQFSGSWGPRAQKAGYYRSNVRPFRLLMA
jgi:hypothetical protein